MVSTFTKMWQWCINHAIFFGTSLLFVTLLIIAICSFTPSNTNNKKVTENQGDLKEEQKDHFEKTKDGYIIYKMMGNITMQKGEIRTFEIPFGTKIQRYNTEGRVTKLSSKGKKYTLRAETDVTFDLTWVIEKGFENKIKPL